MTMSNSARERQTVFKASENIVARGQTPGNRSTGRLSKDGRSQCFFFKVLRQAATAPPPPYEMNTISQAAALSNRGDQDVC